MPEKKEPKIYYVVMKLIKKIEADLVTRDIAAHNLDVSLQTAEGMIGMLPVFEDWEMAEEYACGCDVVKIRTKEVICKG